ncbi:hypothetical protein DY000_02047079 [Brassica cretica]|uniref:Uncharacterized protein n=1 Tax=Brassica cretica TaxID=69181 RepID=A0ABQ7F803_BRACR|nr:hypothetical protein DY000_02047079 [Brassica cretica]
MSLSMRNESTLFARTTGLFTADMKLHLHKTFLNQMFGTWTDSLKALQTCAQVFDYTEDLHTISRTRPRSLKVWLWEGSYSVTTETCRRFMKLLLQDVKFDTKNEGLLYIVVAHICGDCYLELGLKLLLRDVKRNRWYKATNIQAPAGKIQRLRVLVSSAGMERSKINPTKTDGIKISVEMIQASKRPWQVYGHTRHSQAYSNVQALRC